MSWDGVGWMVTQDFGIFAAMKSEVISYLQQLWLTPIPEGDQEVILSSFAHKCFREGEDLFREGKICTQLYFICKGIVRILSTNEKGVDRTHYFYEEGHFCTILKSFTEGQPAEAGIQAACDVEVLVITRKQLEDLYKLIPSLKGVMDRMFQRQLMDKVETRNALLGADGETQYKHFIERYPNIALRVAMKDIASYLGITPQSLSRIRRNIQ